MIIIGHAGSRSASGHWSRPFGTARSLCVAFVPLILLYVAYTAVRWVVAGRGETVGDANAVSVIAFERWSHLDVELFIQRQVLPHDWLIWLVNHYYAYGFFPVLIVCAGLAAIRAPEAFQRWRRIFAVSLGIALLGYAFLPLTPPRLLPQYGFVDTLMLHGPHYYGDASGASLFNGYGSLPSLVNIYAAMPSMHVGWSVMAGALLIAAFPRRRWLLAIAVLHVIAMSFAVIATGNHYLVDAIAGLSVVGVAYALVRAWTEATARRLTTLPV